MKLFSRSLVMATAITVLSTIPAMAAEPFMVINAPTLKSMIDDRENTTRIYDSRSRAEYDQKHIIGAISLPVAEMTANPGQLGTPDESRRVFYCSGAT